MALCGLMCKREPRLISSLDALNKSVLFFIIGVKARLFCGVNASNVSLIFNLIGQCVTVLKHIEKLVCF